MPSAASERTPLKKASVSVADGDVDWGDAQPDPPPPPYLKYALFILAIAFVAFKFSKNSPVESSSSPSPSDYTLNVDVSRHSLPFCSGDSCVSDGVSFTGRGYNGAFGGPVMRFSRGTTVVIETVNNLAPDGDDDNNSNYNIPLRNPNATNLHFHGLHVSPQHFGDNPFRTFENGGKSSFSVIDVRSDHPPGTYFYHPHHHGSSALQVSEGMVGIIIVEDDDDDNDEGEAIRWQQEQEDERPDERPDER